MPLPVVRPSGSLNPHLPSCALIFHHLPSAFPSSVHLFTCPSPCRSLAVCYGVKSRKMTLTRLGILRGVSEQMHSLELRLPQLQGCHYLLSQHPRGALPSDGCTWAIAHFAAWPPPSFLPPKWCDCNVIMIPYRSAKYALDTHYCNRIWLSEKDPHKQLLINKKRQCKSKECCILFTNDVAHFIADVKFSN